MIRTVIHRFVQSLRRPAGGSLVRSETDIAEAIESLDRRLAELRRELEADSGGRLRGAAGAGVLTR